MRRVFFVVAVILTSVAPGIAQVAVYDPAVTFRNSLTAVAKQYLTTIQQEQHRQLRRMARRLSLHTPLNKYKVPDPPRWRTHGGDFLFTQAHNDALIFGDPTGAAYLDLSQPLLAARELLDRVNQTARRELLSRLATINLADATAIAGTHDTGQLRLNGRKQELPAIDALEAHVIDPSRPQRHRGARQDQWRRPHRRAPASGPHTAACRHRRTAPR